MLRLWNGFCFQLTSTSTLIFQSHALKLPVLQKPLFGMKSLPTFSFNILFHHGSKMFCDYCFMLDSSCIATLTVHILLWGLDVLLVLIGCWLNQHGALFLKQLTKGCLLKNPSFHRRIPLVRMVCIMSRTIWDVLWDPEDSFTHMPSTMIMSVKRLDCIFCIQTSFSTAVMSVCFSIWFSIFPYGTFNIMEYFMLFQRA